MKTMIKPGLPLTTAAVGLALSVVCLLTSTASKGQAQEVSGDTNLNVWASQRELIRLKILPRIERLAAEMRTYHARSGSFPRGGPAEDALLKQLYRSIHHTLPAYGITSRGPYRVLGDIQICFDETIRNAQLPVLRKSPPQNWHASPFSTIVIHDGLHEFVVWGSNDSGQPLRDENYNVVVAGGRLSPLQESQPSAARSSRHKPAVRTPGKASPSSSRLEDDLDWPDDEDDPSSWEIKDED